MGCSSSTQTHTQGSNKPPAKTVETNGPMKSASPEGSDDIIDDIETIPDQTKLVPLTENEPTSDEPPAAGEQVEEVQATECDGTEPPAPASEDVVASLSPVEQQEPVTSGQDDSAVEGDIEDAEEAKMYEAITSPGPGTIEDDTGHAVDAGEAEINTANVEE